MVEQMIENNTREYIEKEVHRLYWDHDTNCARTTLHCLSELMNLSVQQQTWAAAVGLHGGGGYRAQCGLVEGGLMFIGIYCGEKGVSRADAVGYCYDYAKSFEERFGALTCRELRPAGFHPDNPPHMCEKLTCDTIEFAYEYLKKLDI